MNEIKKKKNYTYDNILIRLFQTNYGYFLRCKIKIYV